MYFNNVTTDGNVVKSVDETGGGSRSTLNPFVRFRVKHKRVLTCYGLACESMCKNPWIDGINSFRRTAWYWKDVTCKNCLAMRKKPNVKVRVSE